MTADLRRVVQNCLAEMAEELRRPDTEPANAQNATRAADAFLNALDREGYRIAEADEDTVERWLRPVEPR